MTTYVNHISTSYGLWTPVDFFHSFLPVIGLRNLAVDAFGVFFFLLNKAILVILYKKLKKLGVECALPLNPNLKISTV